MAEPNSKLPDPTTQEVQRFWERVDKTPGYGPEGTCWLWTGSTMSKGYGVTSLSGHRQLRAHRIAWKIQTGVDPGRWNVLHRCDVRLCVRIDHLFLGTLADNDRDRDQKGRQAIGGRNGAVLHPERLIRGSAHWTHNNPVRLQRGNEHWTRRHPEKLHRGPRAPLTEEQRIAILSSSLGAKRLGKLLGISHRQIYKLRAKP